MLKTNVQLTRCCAAGLMGLWLTLNAAALAGSLDAPAAPNGVGSAMFTLQDLCNRLASGTAGTKRSGPFAEPTAGPAATMCTLNQVMAAMPAVDAANGAGVADVLAGKTFWGLITGGGWGLQTGTASPAAVPKTGQTTSYATGDDGDLEKGVAWPTPRFTDHSDGTVTDNLTGLMWMKNADAGNDCNGADTGTENWATALSSAAACNTASYAGYTDWRLPNVNELLSLIDRSQFSLALPSNHPFTGVQPDVYWSSTTSANTSNAWVVNPSVGNVNASLKTNTFYVWPVRGGL